MRGCVARMTLALGCSESPEVTGQGATAARRLESIS